MRARARRPWRRRAGSVEPRASVRVNTVVGVPEAPETLRADQLDKMLPDERAKAFRERFVTDEAAITDLASLVGMPVSSVYREIERAESAGLVTSHKVGNTRLVKANTDSPYYVGLADVLVKAFGPPRSVWVEVLRGVASPPEPLKSPLGERSDLIGKPSRDGILDSHMRAIATRCTQTLACQQRLGGHTLLRVVCSDERTVGFTTSEPSDSGPQPALPRVKIWSAASSVPSTATPSSRPVPTRYSTARRRLCHAATTAP